MPPLPVTVSLLLALPISFVGFLNIYLDIYVCASIFSEKLAPLSSSIVLGLYDVCAPSLKPAVSLSRERARQVTREGGEGLDGHRVT